MANPPDEHRRPAPRRIDGWEPRSSQPVKTGARAEVSQSPGNRKSPDGLRLHRLVHSREMKVIAPLQRARPEGKDLSMLLLRIGRGRSETTRSSYRAVALSRLHILDSGMHTGDAARVHGS